MSDKIKEQMQLLKAVNKISIPKCKKKLTHDYLISLEKDIRVQEIAYYITDFILPKLDMNNAILMNGYSPGLKMVQTTWHLEGEVNNGGFYQYFDNNQNTYSEATLKIYYTIVIDSLELINCIKIKDAFLEALDLFRNQANQDKQWNFLDNLYYQNEFELIKNRENYIANNLLEFTI